MDAECVVSRLLDLTANFFFLFYLNEKFVHTNNYVPLDNACVDSRFFSVDFSTQLLLFLIFFTAPNDSRVSLKLHINIQGNNNNNVVIIVIICNVKCAAARSSPHTYPYRRPLPPQCNNYYYYFTNPTLQIVILLYGLENQLQTYNV